ncbi:MAG: hypothetical protein R3F61_00450 [Myxococcota bacterium]
MKYISLASVPLFAFGTLLTIGCTVSDSKPLADIDSDLWAKICDKATDANDAETYECDGFTIEIEARTADQAAADCVTGSDITWGGDCTFGDWVECNDWEPADYCVAEDPPAACTRLAECATAGAGA